MLKLYKTYKVLKMELSLFQFGVLMMSLTFLLNGVFRYILTSLNSEVSGLTIVLYLSSIFLKLAQLLVYSQNNRFHGGFDKLLWEKYSTVGAILSHTLVFGAVVYFSLTDVPVSNLLLLPTFVGLLVAVYFLVKTAHSNRT
jgi:hypothetical protein